MEVLTSDSPGREGDKVSYGYGLAGGVGKAHSREQAPEGVEQTCRCGLSRGRPSGQGTPVPVLPASPKASKQERDRAGGIRTPLKLEGRRREKGLRPAETSNTKYSVLVVVVVDIGIVVGVVVIVVVVLAIRGTVDSSESGSSSSTSKSHCPRRGSSVAGGGAGVLVSVYVRMQ